MLRKLLKYDFKSVFKFWWIGVLTSLVLSALGGGCITVLRAERELPEVVYASAMLVCIISVISLVAFSIMAMILIFVRFYKNFFTDEGYLTFTLPVKTGSLLKSKLMMSVITVVATLIAIAIGVVIMLGIGYADKIFTREFFDMVYDMITSIIEELGWYTLLYAVEGIVMFLLYFVFAILFLFCCITLASVITKKARVITSIGIYYGVNCVISFVLQLFFLFGIGGISKRLAALTEAQIFPVAGLIIFCIIAFEFVVCALLYTLQYYMLDRKLNLA